ncbi:macrolide transport system ATP-binding/permease protein [Paraoerskovia marina]|uniref:Macrolide transport system ATP-binding/permease protein n=1 Tax=Paraoerskovia marina TaxID=545619 RepID=A0A1H1UDG5_9CELL|nr:ABC-F family ATP-binding cassette domain-containing protein [Paraoerskovia marina]SDS70493.1 macrolide transport system ATP-binding/permease protein [Paraoerskovia marina]
MQLVASDLSFSYPDLPVLDRVDLAVGPGARLGVVGENGTGKSTLLRLLAGELDPAGGSVRRDGSLAVVEQEMVVPDDLRVGDLVDASLGELRAVAARLQAETDDFDHESGDLARLGDLMAAAEHLAVWDADRRVDVALSRLGACRDRDRELATLSVGQRFRVRLACRLAERSDLLLLDEPTNHLDDAGLEFLTGELLAWRGGVVVVTHDRELLDDVATAILDLDPSVDGRPVLYGQPGYLAYRFAKNQALKKWRRRYRAERQRAEHLAQVLDRSYEGLSDEWRPPKGSQKHRRATRARQHVKSADRLAQKLEEQAVEVPVPPLELVFPDLVAMAPGWDPGEPVLDVRHPRVESVGSVLLDLPGTRIAVPPSGRLLVTGANGSGKSTLLRALAGSVGLARGTRTVIDGARVGAVEQEGAAVVPGSSGFDAFAREALDRLAAGSLDPEHLVPVAFLGLLSEEDLDRPLSELSAGQRRRFDLARALLTVPHVLLLDEPTNHLSIDLVDELTRALRITPAAVVVATHDRRMRAELADWPTLDLG